MKILKMLMMAAVAVAIVIAGTTSAQAGKIGYVDLSRLFDE